MFFFSPFFLIFCWIQCLVYGSSITVYFDSMYICNSKSPPIIPYIRVYLNSSLILSTSNTNETSDNPIYLNNQQITIEYYPATILFKIYDFNSEYDRRSDELICSLNYTATTSGNQKLTCYSSLHLCTSYINVTTILNVSTTTYAYTFEPTNTIINNSTTLISTITNNAIQQNNVNKNSNIRLIVIIIGTFAIFIIIMFIIYGGYKYYEHKQQNDEEKHSKTAAFIVENNTNTDTNVNTNTNPNININTNNSGMVTNEQTPKTPKDNQIKSPRSISKKLEIVITGVDQNADEGNGN